MAISSKRAHIAYIDAMIEELAEAIEDSDNDEDIDELGEYTMECLKRHFDGHSEDWTDIDEDEIKLYMAYSEAAVAKTKAYYRMKWYCS